MPRILLYSTTTEVSDAPFSILFEHTSGVKSLSFSPDSRWLCSVGDIYDGFIYLWSSNPKTGAFKLHSTNKCTSNIQDVAWMGGSIITVGTRHVKLWRPDPTAPTSPSKSKFRPDFSAGDSPGPAGSSRTLAGRNCLLGPLLESTFTCVAALSETKAVICTDRGDVCVLDDAEGGQKLNRVSKVDYSVRSVTVDIENELVWIGGSTGEIRGISFPLLNSSEAGSPPSERSVEGSPKLESSSIIALGLVRDRLVSIDLEHNIRILKPSETTPNSVHEIPCKHLRSHTAPVLGANILRSLESKITGFITWETSGLVIFWSSAGEFETSKVVPLEQLPIIDDTEANELKVIRPSECSDFFVSGDKYGMLR